MCCSGRITIGTKDLLRMSRAPSLFALLAFGCIPLANAAQADSRILDSPNRTLTFSISVSNGVPTYSINRGASKVILASRLGLEPSLAEGFHIASETPKSTPRRLDAGLWGAEYDPRPV